MAIEKTVSYSGQKNVSTFNGKIRIDDVRGDISILDNANLPRTKMDIEGIKSYNAAAQEVVRTGEMPDHTYGTTAAKPGETIQTIYGQ